MRSTPLVGTNAGIILFATFLATAADPTNLTGRFVIAVNAAPTADFARSSEFLPVRRARSSNELCENASVTGPGLACIGSIGPLRLFSASPANAATLLNFSGTSVPRESIAYPKYFHKSSFGGTRYLAALDSDIEAPAIISLCILAISSNDEKLPPADESLGLREASLDASDEIDSLGAVDTADPPADNGFLDDCIDASENPDSVLCKFGAGKTDDPEFLLKISFASAIAAGLVNCENAPDIGLGGGGGSAVPNN